MFRILRPLRAFPDAWLPLVAGRHVRRHDPGGIVKHAAVEAECDQIAALDRIHRLRQLVPRDDIEGLRPGLDQAVQPHALEVGVIGTRIVPLLDDALDV